MKKIEIKDRCNRALFNENELEIKTLKNIQNNANFLLGCRWRALEQNSMRKSYSSKTKINNRCIKTVSKKAFAKKLKLSRTEFLRKVRSGQVSGLKKSSW